MQVHIFRGPGRVFGVTAEPAGANLPSKYAPWTAFKVIEVQRGQRTPGLDVDECLDDLEQFGVHITDAHVRITEDALK
jgi:hypothetical protein